MGFSLPRNTILAAVPIIVIGSTKAILSGAVGLIYTLVALEMPPPSGMGTLMPVQYIYARLRIVVSVCLHKIVDDVPIVTPWCTRLADGYTNRTIVMTSTSGSRIFNNHVVLVWPMWSNACVGPSGIATYLTGCIRLEVSGLVLKDSTTLFWGGIFARDAVLIRVELLRGGFLYFLVLIQGLLSLLLCCFRRPLIPVPRKPSFLVAMAEPVYCLRV